mgnify:CR=1 FL=1
MDPNWAKFTQNWTFLATYTPDMVIIWPHMACLPIFLSHTTYTSHIPPHKGSNGRQIAVNRGFSGENLPCSRLQKIIMRQYFDLEPCPIHQNDHIVYPYLLYNSDLQNLKIFCLKLQILFNLFFLISFKIFETIEVFIDFPNLLIFKKFSRVFL